MGRSDMYLKENVKIFIFLCPLKNDAPDVTLIFDGKTWWLEMTDDSAFLQHIKKQATSFDRDSELELRVPNNL